jgi:hypothetical protein
MRLQLLPLACLGGIQAAAGGSSVGGTAYKHPGFVSGLVEPCVPMDVQGLY